MSANTIIEQSFFAKHRYLIMLFAIILFLPPLSFLFQFTQDGNFCGTWCPKMFFVWRKGMTVGQFALGLVRSYMGVALVLTLLASTLFLGRYWCSHLCPVGGSLEIGSKLVPEKLKINYKGIPASFFRYGYFSIYLLAPAIGIGSLCCSYCNFGAIPRLFGAAFSGADMAYFLRTAGLINLGLIVLLGFLAKGGRAYCNLLCPVGALDAISNRIKAGRGKRMHVDVTKCDGCSTCQSVCPTWAIDVQNKARIDQLSCMPCRLCEKACLKGAIAYGRTQR